METSQHNKKLQSYFEQLRSTQPQINQPFIDQIVTNSTNKCLKSLQSSQLKILSTPKNIPSYLKDPQSNTSASNSEITRNSNIYKSLNYLSKERKNREERVNERVTRLMEQIKAKEQELQEKEKQQKAQLHKQLHDTLQQKVNQLSQESKVRMKYLHSDKSQDRPPHIPLYRKQNKKFLKEEKELEKKKEEVLEQAKEKKRQYDAQKVKEFEKEYELRKSQLPKPKKSSFHYTPPKNRSHFYDIFSQEVQHKHNQTVSPNLSAIRYDPWKQIPVKLDPEKQKEMHKRLQKLQLPAKEQIFPLLAHQNTYDFRAYAIKNINKRDLKDGEVYGRQAKNNAQVYALGKDYLSQARQVIKTELSQKNSINEIENDNPNANFQKQLYELGRQYLSDQSKQISQKAREEHKNNEWQQIINDPKLTDQQKAEQIELYIKRIEEKVKRKEKLQKVQGGLINLTSNENEEIDRLLLNSMKAKLAML